MKKNILLASAFMFAVAFANAQATATPAVTPTQTDQSATEVKPVENKNQADFKFTETSMEYSYGTIKQGESVTHNFEFTNSGKEPLVITSAHGSCGCTVPDWPKEPIKKGEKGVIKVTFNSAGKMGPQDKTVTINSNAKTNPAVLHIKGNVDKPADAPAPATPDAH
ncbi:MAG: DUF1573 domain-containing protein [Bacteroidia bacterium]